jgi:hypothetical protein
VFVRGFRGERRAAEILAMAIISPALSIFFCLLYVAMILSLTNAWIARPVNPSSWQLCGKFL